MTSRQTGIVRRWLIVDGSLGTPALRRLPPATGLLLLDGQRAGVRLRGIARTHRLPIVEEAKGDAKRVHDLRALRQALRTRTPMILLSPIHPTSSHPEWKAIPRMRAAAMARLAGRRLIALGGMTEKRYLRIRPLGFQGWAGISAFRT